MGKTKYMPQGEVLQGSKTLLDQLNTNLEALKLAEQVQDDVVQRAYVEYINGCSKQEQIGRELAETIRLRDSLRGTLEKL